MSILGTRYFAVQSQVKSQVQVSTQVDASVRVEAQAELESIPDAHFHEHVNVGRAYELNLAIFGRGNHMTLSHNPDARDLLTSQSTWPCWLWSLYQLLMVLNFQ